MSTPRAHHSFAALQESTLLQYLLPELCAGRQVEQPPFHHLDVMRHNLATLDAIERIIDQPGLYFHDCHELISEALEDQGALLALKWAALLHDIGKPSTRKVVGEEAARIIFHHHDEQGAAMVLRIGERWKWSKRKSRRVASLVAMHMHPFHLNNVMQQEEAISRKAMHKICKRAGNDLYPLFLLAMADSVAGQGPDKPDGIEAQIEKLFVAIDRFRRHTLEPVTSGPKLLTGHDLIDTFGLTPGPEVGRLLEAVEAAAVEGVISTREEALAWVEKRCSDGSEHQ